MYFQVMTYAEAESLHYNPFDLTKVPISPSLSHLHCCSPGTSSNCDFISAPHHLQTPRSRIYFSSLIDILLLPRPSIQHHRYGPTLLSPFTRSAAWSWTETHRTTSLKSSSWPSLLPTWSPVRQAYTSQYYYLLEASLLTLPVLSTLLIFRNRAITR